MIAHETPRKDLPAIEIPDPAKCLDELDGFGFVVENDLTAGDAAADMIDRTVQKKAGMSRHEIAPMRGRDKTILIGPHHESTSV